MPLPDDYDAWKHLRNHVQVLHNKRVTKYFRNQADNDLSTNKGRLKKSLSDRGQRYSPHRSITNVVV